MRRIKRNKKFVLLAISLFILILQFVVNHVYGGITLKSFLLILTGWFITVALLAITFSWAYKK